MNISPDVWLDLRMAEVEAAYLKIVEDGAREILDFREYCGAIRFSEVQYSTYAKLSPGVYDNGAKLLIAWTDEIIDALAKSGLSGDSFEKVSAAIFKHCDNLRADLQGAAHSVAA